MRNLQDREVVEELDRQREDDYQAKSVGGVDFDGFFYAGNPAKHGCDSLAAGRREF